MWVRCQERRICKYNHFNYKLKLTNKIILNLFPIQPESYTFNV